MEPARPANRSGIRPIDAIELAPYSSDRMHTPANWVTLRRSRPVLIRFLAENEIARTVKYYFLFQLHQDWSG
jgi:hypothetical protein